MTSEYEILREKIAAKKRALEFAMDIQESSDLMNQIRQLENKLAKFDDNY